jgi:hypothetical protein
MVVSAIKHHYAASLPLFLKIAQALALHWIYCFHPKKTKILINQGVQNSLETASQVAWLLKAGFVNQS